MADTVQLALNHRLPATEVTVPDLKDLADHRDLADRRDLEAQLDKLQICQEDLKALVRAPICKAVPAASALARTTALPDRLDLRASQALQDCLESLEHRASQDRKPRTSRMSASRAASTVLLAPPVHQALPDGQECVECADPREIPATLDATAFPVCLATKDSKDLLGRTERREPQERRATMRRSQWDAKDLAEHLASPDLKGRPVTKDKLDHPESQERQVRKEHPGSRDRPGPTERKAVRDRAASRAQTPNTAPAQTGAGRRADKAVVVAPAAVAALGLAETLAETTRNNDANPEPKWRRLRGFDETTREGRNYFNNRCGHDPIGENLVMMFINGVMILLFWLK